MPEGTTSLAAQPYRPVFSRILSKKSFSACFACSAVIVVSGTVKLPRKPDTTFYVLHKELATRAPGAMVAGAPLSVSIANPAAAL
jgi:hypothetical protein